MSTLKTTYIQHPDSENPQILLSASGMLFSASVFQATGGTLDLPSITTIAGSEILTQASGSNQYLPISSASTQFSLKADLISPALTGTPTAPTAASGTNTTQIATTAYSFEAASSASANANLRALDYANSASANADLRALDYANSASAHAVVVSNQHTDSSISSASGIIISNIVASAPETLDTLNELAAALGNDANFSTTVTNNIATKLSIASASSTYATFAFAVEAASSASANVNTRALSYANSASANVNAIVGATYLTQAAASVTYLTQENVPPSQYKAFSLFLSGM